jgi:hypothetical protein
MDGRNGAGVPGVQELQKVEGLAASDFSELRSGYACGWCHLKQGVLSVIPHPLSKCEVRRFEHPREAEVIGRVIGVAMRIANSVEDERGSKR